MTRSQNPIVLFCAAVFVLGLLNSSCSTAPREEKVAEATHQQEDSIVIQNLEFGFNLDQFIVYQGQIGRNQFLADILLPHHVSYPEISRVAANAADIFDVRKINAGKRYTVLCVRDSIEKAAYFIYQPDLVNYVVYELRDSMRVYRGQKEVETRRMTFEGNIESSLYVTLSEQDAPTELALRLASLYAWTIDFYRIQKGDRVKIIYEEEYVGDTRAGLGEIIAANFVHNNRDYYAFHFTQDSIPDFFDDQGNSLRKAFLKMPLKYGRLTSGFTKRRFHPVQKRFKAHLGTDYAAPKGTPILAVGDGVVIESQFRQYNGNYVKIRHNSTYTTQYLHMSKRLVKAGEYVMQGQTIGLVGSTGLATGPHVCFRFWKNGAQVDHRREEFPPSEPILPENQNRYQTHIDSLIPKVSFDKPASEMIANQK